MTQVAAGIREELLVFGNDYQTPDGTGVRDYIHVMDLVEGHIRALASMQTGMKVYNLGTGRGYSVLEVINTFESVTGVAIPRRIVERRPGDIDACYADAQRAKDELNWIAQSDLRMMLTDAWRWQQNRSTRA